MNLRQYTGAFLRKPDWLNMRTLATVLVIKAIFFVFAWHCCEIIAQSRVTGMDDFLSRLSRWDAESYLYIAENGYDAEGPKRFLLVFLPLYPLLTAGFAFIFRNYLVSAFFVTTIASLFAALFFRLLVRLDHPEKTAQAAVLFLFIFPTSLFLHIPYTESLFLALVIGCFWAARTEQWMLAGILGFFACTARVNGIVLIPALAFEVLEQYRLRKTLNRRWSWMALVPGGFAAYLAVNYHVSGSALKFLDYQRENWWKYMRFPYEGIKEKVYTFLEQGAEAGNMYGLQELLYAAIGLIFIVFGWKYMRNSYRVWMVLNWLLFISTSFILSVPRYSLTMFPMFILMALASRRNQVLGVGFMVWSVLFLGLFTARFVSGGWAF